MRTGFPPGPDDFELWIGSWPLKPPDVQCAWSLHWQLGSDAAHVPVQVKDAPAGKQGEYELVLTNPPFSKKRSVTIQRSGPDEQRVAHHPATRYLNGVRPS